MTAHRHRPPARGDRRLEDVRRGRRAASPRRWPSARARSTRSWAPTAPARARSSRSSPAPSAPTAARSPSAAGERTVHSPAEARRGGLVSVYQEPALIPDLDIRSNLRLTETPIEPFRHWLHELGLDRPRPVEHGAARAAGLAPDHRPRPRAGHRARRADARRDDRGAAREPDRARPRGRRPPARRRSLGHLHLPPHDRDRRRLRPGDRAARGRDGRRRRRHRRAPRSGSSS